MLDTMEPKLYKKHENMKVYDMIKHLVRLYKGQARNEGFEVYMTLFQYFITFKYDYKIYRYVYLMKHKSKSLDKFKEFKHEVKKTS